MEPLCRDARRQHLQSLPTAPGARLLLLAVLWQRGACSLAAHGSLLPRWWAPKAATSSLEQQPARPGVVITPSIC